MHAVMSINVVFIKLKRFFTSSICEENSGSNLQLENGAKQTPNALLGDLRGEHGNDDGCCAACCPRNKPRQENPFDEKTRLRNVSRKSMENRTIKSLTLAGKRSQLMNET